MNFAHHCSYAPDPQYPSVFECATIGGGIRDCQRLGKKFLISLGGDTCDGTLGSPARARKLAYNIWNMFLGGQDMPGKRPFLRSDLSELSILQCQTNNTTIWRKLFTWLWRWLPPQVVKTSVTNNTLSEDCSHPDDHTRQTTDTPRFKPFTIFRRLFTWLWRWLPLR